MAWSLHSRLPFRPDCFLFLCGSDAQNTSSRRQKKKKKTECLHKWEPFLYTTSRYTTLHRNLNRSPRYPASWVSGTLIVGFCGCTAMHFISTSSSKRRPVKARERRDESVISWQLYHSVPTHPLCPRPRSSKVFVNRGYQTMPASEYLCVPCPYVVGFRRSFDSAPTVPSCRCLFHRQQAQDYGYLLRSLTLLETRTQAFRCRSIGRPALGCNRRSWQQLCNTLYTLS